MGNYLPVHAITDALAVKYAVEPAYIASILLSTYILTGCDTVSYFYRRGKRRAYKATIARLQGLEPLAKYGNDNESLTVQDDVISSARLYVLTLYDRNEFEGNLDALCAHLFGNIKGDMRVLPPTEDAFQLHLLRALHQLVICKRAHLSQPIYPVATDFGRHIVNGKLVSIMMLKAPKPAESKRVKYCRQ